MSSDSQSNPAKATEEADVKADRSPAPIFLIALFALLIYWGMIYLDNHGGGFNPRVYEPYASINIVEARQPPPISGPDPRIGRKIFGVTCVACHQSSGLGLPGQFPPLAGSDWVAAQSPNRIIRAVLGGLTGPITVSGQSFNNNMLAWGTTVLTNNNDVAAVLTFVRQNKEWGNNAPPVTAEQVKAIRAKIADHSQQFTPDELLKIPEGQ